MKSKRGAGASRTSRGPVRLARSGVPTRMIVHGKYLIIYRPREDEGQILRIVMTTMGWWRRREKARIVSREGTSGAATMEHIAKIHIERLPEGVYLATSDDVPGLVAQGRTIAETLEIARDVAKKLIELQSGTGTKLQPIENEFDYPLIIAV